MAVMHWVCNVICAKTLIPLQQVLGGQCDYYIEEAVLVFTDTAGQALAHRVELGIQRIRQCLWKRPNPSILRTPCLLGRDILSALELRYDHQKGYVELRAS